MTWHPTKLYAEVLAEFRSARHPAIPTPDDKTAHDEAVATLMRRLAAALEDSADSGVRRRIVRIRRET